MTALVNLDCKHAGKSDEILSNEEIQGYLEQVPEWRVIEKEGQQRLSRRFDFDDFKYALAFTNRVGALAEQQNHHPLIVTEWGAVTLHWWTHVLGGLFINDFIMAAKSDQAYLER